MMMFLTHLPYDLERTILEYTARADRLMALTLLLVSREVKRWWARNQGFVCLPLTSWFRIEPILYRHITLNNLAQTDAFIHTLNSPRPRSPQFFANIRSISFTYGVTFHQAAKILSVCSNITTLSCHIEFSRQNLNVSLDDIDNFRCFMTTSSPTLKRLSVTLHPFILCPDPDFRAPVLQNLSHLCIFGSSDNCHKWLWRGLDALKHLTHLALEIDTSTPLQAIYNMAPHFPPLLHVCLVIISIKKMPIQEYLAENKEIQQLVSGDTDRRVVIGTSETLETLGSIAASGPSHLIQMTQWGDILGNRTAWEEAEKIIRYRMRNSG